MSLIKRTASAKSVAGSPQRPMPARNGAKPTAASGASRGSREGEYPPAHGERLAPRTNGSGDLKFKIHERLVRELDPTKLNSSDDSDRVRRSVEEAADQMLQREGVRLARSDRAQLASQIADEVLGYGPIEPLLKDPTITEVIVNRPDRVFYEREGILYLSDQVFRDDQHILRIIERIVAPIGRRIDESSPMVDARLPDGSRVNAIIPPLAVHGPSVTIRKFSRDPLTTEDLVLLGTWSVPVAELIKACVMARLNIVISGGTGTGKTTLLNILSGFIPNRERIVTIEDPAELQIRQDDWVSLETRPPNIEGKGEVIQRDLVRNALRMRPDRIIVGECRAGEAFDMLQAMNTGHEGSMTTIHANSPRDAISRAEDMVLMAKLDLPLRAVREQIASAIHLVVHLARFRDGTRRVTNIAEIVGIEGQVVTMHDLFAFQHTGVDEEGKIAGKLVPTGIRPHFVERIEMAGIPMPPGVFDAPTLAPIAMKGRELW
ncbi:MAG: CpaF family protein [Chloroflexi bacterium]|nr:CpaF family protein [Chloroflexota bacterium]